MSKQSEIERIERAIEELKQDPKKMAKLIADVQEAFRKADKANEQLKKAVRRPPPNDYLIGAKA